jgi:hypothetical protein
MMTPEKIAFAEVRGTDRARSAHGKEIVRDKVSETWFTVSLKIFALSELDGQTSCAAQASTQGRDD